MLKRSLHRVALPALFLLALPSSARAQARDPVAAEALFAEGRAAMKRGDYASAYAKLQDSETLDPAAVGTLLNLAECEEHLGKLASAWQHWRRALDQLPAGDDRIAFGSERIKALEGQLPRLTIRLAKDAPASTRIRRGDVDVGEASLGVPLPADPGTYDVVASAPGFLARHFQAELRVGAVTELLVDVGLPLAAPAPRGDSSWRTASFAVGSVGIAGLGVGVVTGILAIDRNNTVKSECPNGACTSNEGATAAQQGRAFATTSTVGFIAGGVLLAAGVVVLLTHPRRSESKGSAVSWTPRGLAW